MHQFKELAVWQKAVTLATNIYESTRSFPSEEKFGLTSQIRRSVISISSNIAEGAGRKTNNEFKHFLNIAYGSGSELETQILIAQNLGFLKGTDYNVLSEKITEIQNDLFIIKFTKSRFSILITTISLLWMLTLLMEFELLLEN